MSKSNSGYMNFRSLSDTINYEMKTEVDKSFNSNENEFYLFKLHRLFAFPLMQ